MEFLGYHKRFFTTGEMSLYDDSQRVWMKDQETFMTVLYKDKASPPLITISIDRSQLLINAGSAIASIMTNLHVWLFTVDEVEAIAFDGNLTVVDSSWLQVREGVIVKAKYQAPRISVPANTFLDIEVVSMKEYGPTVEGVIQSWCEREG
jgi:dipeptidyl-peptidase-3